MRRVVRDALLGVSGVAIWEVAVALGVFERPPFSATGWLVVLALVLVARIALTFAEQRGAQP